MNVCLSMLWLSLLVPTGDRERGLQLYEADLLSGPWTVPTQIQDETKNTITATINQFSFFAIAYFSKYSPA